LFISCSTDVRRLTRQVAAIFKPFTLRPGKSAGVSPSPERGEYHKQNNREIVMSKLHVQNTMADNANASVDYLASGAHEAVDKIAGAAAQAAESIEGKGAQLKDLQVQWLETSRKYIRDNPGKALGIAVVGGFLLSRLLSSR
jgi:ElaB/YqjD/DUF883 family membrane-anchored ribosome-binding protein